ncbi:MAG: ABC transporter permease subunit [Candidatus Marinimicrobia bacterium]|nr:ABC transporter permease subunit [Candidatus Neomarinimicrobiota bacterium]MCF7840956.1 ABC transporter permease subunit [Candidatus Neomarinimicrobiota bacterium]MCF7903193.1 ABC transporter permease subunit [Candidatus Neomarinimicrobiota bacterium]
MSQRALNTVFLAFVILLIVGLTPHYAPRVKLLPRENPHLIQEWRSIENPLQTEPDNPFPATPADDPFASPEGPATNTTIQRHAQSVNLNWYNLSKLAILKGLFFTLFIGLGSATLIIFGGLVLGVFMGSTGYVHRAQRTAQHVRTLFNATDIIPRYFIVIILIQFGRNLPEVWKFIYYLLVFAVVQLPEAVKIFELETRQICAKPFFSMARTVGATVRRLIGDYILVLAKPKYVSQFLKYALYTLFMESALSFLQIGFTLENFFRYKVYTLGYILGRLLRENLTIADFATGFPVLLATALILGIVIILNAFLARRHHYA